MFLARWPDSDFNVLAQGGKERHKTSDGEVTRTVPHEQGDLRLLHAEEFGDLGLFQTAALDDCMDLQGELRLEQFLLGVGKAKVGKDVPAAFGDAGKSMACSFGSRFHF